MKIKSCTGELPLNVAKVSIERLDFFIDLINSQYLYSVLLNGDKSAVVIVKEENLIDYLLVGSSIEAFSGLNIPNYQHIPVFEM